MSEVEQTFPHQEITTNRPLCLHIFTKKQKIKPVKKAEPAGSSVAALLIQSTVRRLQLCL